MLRPLVSRTAASVCVAAALLSGCVGALTPSDGAGNAFQSARSRRLAVAPLDAGTRAKDLLYVSNRYDCAVYVFTYPRGKLVQTLNVCDLGFGPAFGLCSDKGGDVFMTMGAGFSVFKFAHGGSQPVAQLESDSLLPVGCSVDPKSGDLGIASATGNVAVYRNGSGTPAIYSLPGISQYFFCTFDGRGNLFADGELSRDGFALVELLKGGSELHELTVSGNRSPGFALQWDGRHLALGGTQGSNAFTIDRIKFAGSVGRVIGTTTLEMSPNTSVPFQFWIQDHTIVQPENGNADVGFWQYPKGGGQTRSIRIGGSSLDGVTVSTAP